MTVRPPKQDRSRRTLDRLVAAALELMADQGVERTSVAQIVRKAKSSVGSFYARFEGKDDFVRYLEERVWADATERWDSAVSQIEGRNATTPELVAGVVRLLVETGRADRAQRRVLGQATGSAERARRFHNHVRWGVTRLLSQRRREFKHPAPERAIPLGYGVIARAVDGLDTLRQGLQRGDDEELITELTRLYLAYLGSEQAPPRARPSRTGEHRVTVSQPTPAAVPETPGPVPATKESLPSRGEPRPVAASQVGETQELAARHTETGEAPPEGPPADQETSADEAERTRAKPDKVDFFDVWG